MTVSCKTFAVVRKIWEMGMMTVSCRTCAIARRIGEMGVGVILYTFM